MPGLRSLLKRGSEFATSTRGKVVFIASLFLGVALLLQAMMYFQTNIFAGVRSYVRGEGLWAKAQKDAVFALSRYSYSYLTTDFQNFEQALTVIDGDTQARLALLSSPPDIEAARQGFLQGGNHELDVPILIWFFNEFHQVSYMRKAIAIWEQADSRIIELRRLGDDVHQLVASGALNTQPGFEHDLHDLRNRLTLLNSQLTDLEVAFSSTLAEAARWVRHMVQLAGFLALVLFVSIASYVSLLVLRSISKAERVSRINEDRFRSLKESDTIGIVTWHSEGHIEEANDYFLQMLGYTRADLLAGLVNWRLLTPPEWRLRDIEALRELRRDGHVHPFEKAYWHKDGHKVPVLVGASQLDNEENYGMAYILDLSERKQAEDTNRLWATVFSASSEGILICNANMNVVSANQAFCRLSGFDEAELIGQVPQVFQSAYTAPDKYRDMLANIYSRGHWEGDLLDRTKSGELLPVRVSISVVNGHKEEDNHYVAIISDISERKAREEALHHIAHHDMLTGLPNRTLFGDRFNQAIKRAKRNGSQLALIFIDLDDFKPINDNFGHLAGDKLLQLVAERLRQSFRNSDTIARLGGDEFLVLLEEISSRSEVVSIVTKAQAHLAAPFVIEDNSIDVSVSIGTSYYPDNGQTIENLLRHADEAMYIMKNQSKGQRPPPLTRN